MKIISLKFNTNKIRVIFSFLFSKIFNKINTSFLSNIDKIKFNYNFKLSKNDVLIKTLICGYCGTDKKILNYDMSPFSSAFLDTNKDKKKDIYLGHELLGVILKKGKNVKKFKINDKVILDSVVRSKNFEKNNIFGGFTNLLVRNQNQLRSVHKNIKNELAILIEPLACSLGAIKKANIKNGDKILIIGAGIIGQGIIHLLRYFYKDKIKIVIATNSLNHKEIIKKSSVNKIIFKKDIFLESSKFLKTKLKKRFKNKILAEGYDKIFECSGTNKIANNILRLANYNSEIILVGMNMNNFKFDPTPIWHRNITIKGVNGFERKYPDIKIDTLKYIHNLIKIS